MFVVLALGEAGRPSPYKDFCYRFCHVFCLVCVLIFES